MRTHFLLILVALAAFVAAAQSPPPSEKMPSVLHLESLDYPRVALFAQIEGTVKLAVEVSLDGGVIAATATSGHDFLRKAAVENIKKWRFEPGPGKTFNVTYQFELVDPPIRDPHSQCSFDLPDRVLVTSNRQAVVGRP